MWPGVNLTSGMIWMTSGERSANQGLEADLSHRSHQQPPELPTHHLQVGRHHSDGRVDHHDEEDKSQVQDRVLIEPERCCSVLLLEESPGVVPE